MAKNRITFSNELVLRDGKVGIGTSAPNSQLSVFGAAEIEGVIKIVSSGTTSGEIIEQKHYRDNGGSIAYESGDRHLFSVSNETDDLLYVINDDDGSSVFSINKSGLGTITALNVKGDVNIGLSLGVGNSVGVSSYIQTPTVDFLSVGSTETSKITAKHYSNNDGSLVLQSGDENLFSVTNERDLYYSINDSEAKPALTVSDLGITTVRDLFQNRVNFTSVGSTDIENIQINHYQNIAYQPAVGSTTNNKGAISFDSSAGISSDGITFFPASLFAVSNGGGNIFSVGGYRYFSGSPFPVIDVTYSGRLGIGTTNPSVDFEIKKETYYTGPNFVFRTQAQIQDKLIFSEQLSPGLTSTTSIIVKPRTPGISTYAPTRGSILFEGILEQSLNGGQLVTVVNDNNSLFTVNRFAGLSTTNVAGTRSVETLFDVASSGNIGIGTTNPQAGLDVVPTAQFRTRVGFSQTANPNATSVVDINSYTPGITTYVNKDSSAMVITRNRNNTGSNSGQLYTVENDDNTLFRVNVVGFGLTTESTPTTPIYPALDITNDGNINIFDTQVRQSIQGFSTTAPISGDGDIFRVDAYATSFIGSFPTVSKAVRVDKFGMVEINRNINQISGITTVGLGSTSTPSINSTMSFELTDNTTLTVRVRGTDGVVRTGIVSLS